METIFIDIETVPNRAYDEALQKRMTRDEYEAVASLKGQYCKIICIGWAIGSTIRSMISANEKELLLNFINEIGKEIKEKSISKPIFCGHNIIAFDLPIIYQRCLANGIKVPHAFRLHNKKPWEVTHIDTMLLWKSIGQSNVSLDDLYFALFGKTTKNDTSGADIKKRFEEGKFGEIQRYCEADVLATMRIYEHISELCN